MVIEPSESIEILFGDATFISRKEFEELPLTLRTHSDSDAADENADKLAQHLASHSRAGGWILVGAHREREEEWALERARRIASALNIGMLRMTRRKHNVLILGDMYSFPYMSTMAVTQEGLFSNNTDHNISTPASRIYTQNEHSFTRETLSELLARENLAPLTNILTQPTKGHPDTKVREALCKAARHLYWSLDTKTAEGQLVGEITTIEMLPRSTNADSKSTYSQIESRVITLLSSHGHGRDKSVIEGDDGQSLFSLRHGIVHRGEDITRGIANRAIQLAIEVLFSYPSFAQGFNAPAEIIAYLDLMRQMEHLSPKALNEMLSDWISLTPQCSH